MPVVYISKGCVHARVDMSQAQLNIQSTDRLLNQMVNLSFEYVLFRIHACLDSQSTLFRNILISYTYVVANCNIYIWFAYAYTHP